MTSINNNSPSVTSSAVPDSANQANINAGLLPAALQSLQAQGSNIQATADGKNYLALDQGRLRVYDTQGSQVGDFGPVPNQPITYNVGGTTVNFDGSGKGAVGSNAQSPSNQYWFSPSMQNIVNNVPSDYPATSAVSTVGSGDSYSALSGSNQSRLLNVPASGLTTGADASSGAGADTDLSGLSTGTSSVGAQSNAAMPDNAVDATTLGVSADGSSDVTSSLNAALQTAKAQGKTLWLPAGTYNHSGVINVDGASLAGAGTGTVLHATDPNNEAIKLSGDGASLSNIATTVNANEGGEGPLQAAVLLDHATNAKVTNISTQGAMTNGVRLDGASGCTLDGVSVNGTNADGIALTDGSTNNLITHSQVLNAADDSFSSDSYNKETPNSGNVFDSCYAGPNNGWGRSFAFMGSQNETLRNSVADGSQAMGIVAGGDPTRSDNYDYSTRQASGIKLENNLVVNQKSGNPAVQFTSYGNNVDASGIGSESGTQTSGDAASVLGWEPDTNVAAPSTFSSYVPGSGAGSVRNG